MKNKLIISLLVMILLCVYWQWILLPGARVANDFPSISQSFLKSSMSFPYVWSETGAEGLGEYSASFLWGWPTSFIEGIIGNLGFNFIFIEKVVIFLPVIIFGAIGIWKISEDINLSNISRFVTSIFYMSSTYIILLIDGGQLSIAIAYAWFPISFLALKKSINSNLRSRILAGISATILGFFDIRFVYILILLSLILFLYELLFIRRKNFHSFFLNWIKSGLVLSVVFLGSNFYWLYPFLIAPISSGTYQIFTQAYFLNFVNLGHALLTLSPHWFINVFGKLTPLRVEFTVIPVIILIAPLLKSKNRDVGFWLLVAIISVFLAKGTSEPLSGVYLWLFNHLPGFSLFRDSTKFFFLIMLSYSLLFGISIEEIIKKINLSRKVKIVFSIITILFLFFLMRPVFLGQMTGTLSSPSLQKEYKSLASLLEMDKTFGRVFWIPSFPSLGYADLNHPRIEAARAAQKRSFAVAIKGSYETFNFLRESPYMGEIFDVAGISYIAYPYLDLRRDDMHPDNIKYYYTFLDQLAKRSWLSKVNNSSIPLLKTKQHQDRFFTTPNIWWIIGSDKILNEVTATAKLSLSKNALIFVEEFLNLGKRIDELPDAKIVLNNKTNTDLAASFVDSTNFVFPSKQLDFKPDKSGWWKRGKEDLISWRDFLVGKYNIDNQDFDLGGGWAIGEGNLKLEVQSEKFKKGKILLARVLESTKSGELDFHQDGHLIGRIDTKKEGDNIRWFEVGLLISDNINLEISSLGDVNVVNALVVLDKDEWLTYFNKSMKLQDRIASYTANNSFNDDNLKVSYKKINPTKYIVNITNLTKPTFLIFSQAYDSLWKMDGKTALPIYSLLNGFKIENNGQYIIEFEPQKYVYPGLIISLITIVVFVLILFKTGKSS